MTLWQAGEPLHQAHGLVGEMYRACSHGLRTRGTMQFCFSSSLVPAQVEVCILTLIVDKPNILVIELRDAYLVNLCFPETRYADMRPCLSVQGRINLDFSQKPKMDTEKPRQKEKEIHP